MNPDAIILFSAGVVPLASGELRTTTYEESDAFGTLGGRDRVEATALLAKKNPQTLIMVTSQSMGGIYARELEALGVAPERIVSEDPSSNTGASVVYIVEEGKRRGWKSIVVVSSEFHIPRIKAFFEQVKSGVEITFLSSESVLAEADPSFTAQFAEIKQSPAYQMRLAAEARGVEAIKNGTYHPASIEDKRERGV